MKTDPATLDAQTGVPLTTNPLMSTKELLMKTFAIETCRQWDRIPVEVKLEPEIATSFISANE